MLSAKMQRRLPATPPVTPVLPRTLSSPLSAGAGGRGGGGGADSSQPVRSGRRAHSRHFSLDLRDVEDEDATALVEEEADADGSDEVAAQQRQQQQQHGHTQAAGISHHGSPSSSSVASTPERQASAARICFLRHRNTLLQSRLVEAARDAERQQSSARNLTELLQAENAQLKARLEAFQSMTTAPPTAIALASAESASSTPSASAAAAAVGGSGSKTPSASTPNASASSVVSTPREQSDQAAAEKIRFYERQLDEADEALVQAKSAWHSTTTILQAQITTLECELGASRAELLSLRHSLRIQEQLQDKLRTALEKKVARLHAALSAAQQELTRTKMRATALEGQIDERRAGDAADSKRRVQIHMPHSARASSSNGGVVGAGSLSSFVSHSPNPFAAEYSTETQHGSGASSRSGSFSAAETISGGGGGAIESARGSTTSHFVSPPSSRPGSSSPSSSPSASPTAAAAAAEAAAASDDLQLETLNLSSGSDGSAAAEL